MVGMGYNLEEIQDSLAKMKYDEITATYLLLGRKASEVQRHTPNLSLAKPRPNSELNGQSPSHLKVHRSVSSNHKQRRYSEQGEQPAGMAHPKRSQTTTADNSAKDESGAPLRKPSTPGGRGGPPSSPLLGNANNPNKADIPERKKGATTGPTNNSASAGMTRRNTYVCSDRNNTDRLSVIPNGKENRNPVASTHSISNATTPDRLRFPRGTASRSTFHGGQLRDRRTATYNGPPASPTLSHDATPLSQTRSRGTSNLFSKLTSKLTRRVSIDPAKRQIAKTGPANPSTQGGKTLSKSSALCFLSLLISFLFLFPPSFSSSCHAFFPSSFFFFYPVLMPFILIFFPSFFSRCFSFFRFRSLSFRFSSRRYREL
uniref:non-specific serine/threonine protein kinase n=1 Tax=Poecilia mexicana TaxID=48701 RepID=A0A3B3WRZ0_9TELE